MTEQILKTKDPNWHDFCCEQKERQFSKGPRTEGRYVQAATSWSRYPTGLETFTNSFFKLVVWLITYAGSCALSFVVITYGDL